MKFVDLALGKGDKIYASEIELLVESCNIFLVA
jgi:hypothetical protein